MKKNTYSFCQCGNLGSQIWLINSLNGRESTYLPKNDQKHPWRGDCGLWLQKFHGSYSSALVSTVLIHSAHEVGSTVGKWEYPTSVFWADFFSGRHMRTYGFIADYMEFIVNVWGPVFFGCEISPKLGK